MKTFEKICEDNYGRIYKYILGMTANSECAKDLTQEVFLIAYKQGKKFEKHEKPEAFLYTTAKNLVLAYFRKSKKEILMEPDENLSDKEGDIFQQLCKSYEDSIETEKYKAEVLKYLSEQNRQLYHKYYIQHQAMREIAAEMGASETAIRMKYVRLRKEVKRIVKNLKLGEF